MSTMKKHSHSKRKLSDESCADDSGAKEEGENEKNNDGHVRTSKSVEKDGSNSDSDEDNNYAHEGDSNERKKKKRKIRKLDLTEVENFNEKLKKRGIVYIARIPPTMGPSKVKSLMTDFGEVTRVYLREEDKATRKRRKRAGTKSGGKRYIEGWVEFAERWVAKRVGNVLNNTAISMEKRNKFYGELWNVKFIRKLEWSHLTEKAACERRLREQKLMKELLKAKKENANFAAKVQEGHKRDLIDEKRRKQAEKRGEELPDTPERQFYIRQQQTFEDQKKEGNKAMLGSLF